MLYCVVFLLTLHLYCVNVCISDFSGTACLILKEFGTYCEMLIVLYMYSNMHSGADNHLNCEPHSVSAVKH